MNLVRSRFGQKMDLVGNQRLSKDEFQAIEPLNLHAGMRLRGLGKFGGPDFPQMEPTDQLDAPARKTSNEPRRAVAKRKYASRASPIFLTNPTVSTTSQFERFGCCWLRRRPLPRQTAMDVVLTVLIAKLFDFDRLGAEPASCRSKAGHIPLSRQSQNVPMTLGPFWYLPRNDDIRSAHRLSIIDGARQPQRVSCVTIPASQPQSTTRRTTARTLI
jgi:hypothetical protein